MRPVLALSGWLVRRHLRGPLVAVVVLAFLALAIAQPDLGSPGSAVRQRGAVALLVGTGGLVLLLLALVLPFASISVRRQAIPGGGPTLPGRQLGALLGHGLTLCLVTCLLAVICQGMLRLRIGDPDARGTKPLVRTVWGQAPDTRTRLTLGGESLYASFDFNQLPREQPVVRVRLAPTMFLDPDHAGTAAHGLTEGAIDLRWRVAGQRRIKHEILRFRRGKPMVVTLRLRESNDLLHAQGADWLSGVLELKLSRRGGGQIPVFEPGSIMLLGTRASLLSTTIRSYFLVGLSALSILAVCLWFSGFVSYPLAVAATLTVALFTLFMSRVIPGVPPVDPSDLISIGAAVSWSDLTGAAARVAMTFAVAVALPVVDRRLSRGGAA